MDSKNNAIANAFKEVLGQKNDFGKVYGRADEELVSLFENLHNVLSSSLNIFLGIGENTDSKNALSNIGSFSAKEYNLSITTAKIDAQKVAQNEQQWQAKEIEIESLELSFLSANLHTSSFTFNA